MNEADRCSSDSTLAWEPPNAVGAALKYKNKNKNKKQKKMKVFKWPHLLGSSKEMQHSFWTQGSPKVKISQRE